MIGENSQMPKYMTTRGQYARVVADLLVAERGPEAPPAGLGLAAALLPV